MIINKATDNIPKHSEVEAWNKSHTQINDKWRKVRAMIYYWLVQLLSRKNAWRIVKQNKGEAIFQTFCSVKKSRRKQLLTSYSNAYGKSLQCTQYNMKVNLVMEYLWLKEGKLWTVQTVCRKDGFLTLERLPVFKRRLQIRDRIMSWMMSNNLIRMSE